MQTEAEAQVRNQPTSPADGRSWEGATVDGQRVAQVLHIARTTTPAERFQMLEDILVFADNCRRSREATRSHAVDDRRD